MGRGVVSRSGCDDVDVAVAGDDVVVDDDVTYVRRDTHAHVHVHARVCVPARVCDVRIRMCDEKRRHNMMILINDLLLSTHCTHKAKHNSFGRSKKRMEKSNTVDY